MWKSRSKIALFSNEHHFEIWFSKKKTITFFWSKLSKLHKKDPILHVTTTFSLKQEETRTSNGLIPHPLRLNVHSRSAMKLCRKTDYLKATTNCKDTFSIWSNFYRGLLDLRRFRCVKCKIWGSIEALSCGNVKQMKTWRKKITKLCLKTIAPIISFD